MAQEIKYTHKELVKAVERIQDLCDFKREVDASQKAGEILNRALDDMEKSVVQGLEVHKEGESENFDNSEFGL